MSVTAVDMNLGEHRKRNVIAERAELPDLSVAVRFLAHELIAWKPQNKKTLLAISILQLLKRLILPSKSALTGYINNKKHRTSVDIQGDIFAVNGCGRKIEGRWLGRYLVHRFRPFYTESAS